jgi:hypothetical protein
LSLSFFVFFLSLSLPLCHSPVHLPIFLLSYFSLPIFPFFALLFRPFYPFFLRFCPFPST